MISLAILLPVLGALALLLVGNRDGSKDGLIRNLTLGISMATFGVTLALWATFDQSVSAPAFQFVERLPWIPAFGIEYYVGIDGLSLMLIVLTGFLTPIALLTSWESIEHKVKEFSIFMLILEAAMIGVFASLDLFLFYIFWDILLIPMYFLIGIWGYDQRLYAAIKFILYTLAGSVLMLIAIIGLSWMHHAATGTYSFDVLKLYALEIPYSTQYWFFLAFALAFAIKVPLFPFHTWLPDAHVQAPTPGSVILAGVLLKMGGYGLIRFAFPLFPEAAAYFAPFIAVLSVIAIVYGALIAMVQPDMKKLVAYSSVAHMGFVTLGFFIFNDLGVAGGLVQMIAHGFVSGAMFLCIGVLYDRVHSREIASYGGVINTMPKFAAFSLLFAMANCGLPGTAGFVGEWMVILGAVKYNFWIGLAAASALIFGAAYTLWMFKRVYLGPVANDDVKNLSDINNREFLVLGLLALAVLYMGIYPKPFTDVMDASVADLLKHVALSKLN
jgi:NADH-quinone oxidoreductase subunit M